MPQLMQPLAKESLPFIHQRTRYLVSAAEAEIATGREDRMWGWPLLFGDHRHFGGTSFADEVYRGGEPGEAVSPDGEALARLEDLFGRLRDLAAKPRIQVSRRGVDGWLISSLLPGAQVVTGDDGEICLYQIQGQHWYLHADADARLVSVWLLCRRRFEETHIPMSVYPDPSGDVDAYDSMGVRLPLDEPHPGWNGLPLLELADVYGTILDKSLDYCYYGASPDRVERMLRWKDRRNRRVSRMSMG